MKYISQALQNLLPKYSSWRMNGTPTTEQEFNSMFELVTGKDETDTAIYSTNSNDFGVTWSQIQEEVARLKELEITEAYKAKRQAEYPLIGDQLDALWKGGDAAAEMLTKVQAVKTKYPKPS
jgi:hypothetical protein